MDCLQIRYKLYEYVTTAVYYSVQADQMYP